MAKLTRHDPEPVVVPRPTYTLELTEAEFLVLKLHLSATTIDTDIQLMQEAKLPHDATRPTEKDIQAVWKLFLNECLGAWANSVLEFR